MISTIVLPRSASGNSLFTSSSNFAQLDQHFPSKEVKPFNGCANREQFEKPRFRLFQMPHEVSKEEERRTTTRDSSSLPRRNNIRNSKSCHSLSSGIYMENGVESAWKCNNGTQRNSSGFKPKYSGNRSQTLTHPKTILRDSICETSRDRPSPVVKSQSLAVRNSVRGSGETECRSDKGVLLEAKSDSSIKTKRVLRVVSATDKDFMSRAKRNKLRGPDHESLSTSSFDQTDAGVTGATSAPEVTGLEKVGRGTVTGATGVIGPGPAGVTKLTEVTGMTKGVTGDTGTTGLAKVARCTGATAGARLSVAGVTAGARLSVARVTTGVTGMTETDTTFKGEFPDDHVEVSQVQEGYKPQVEEGPRSFKGRQKDQQDATSINDNFFKGSRVFEEKPTQKQITSTIHWDGKEKSVKNIRPKPNAFLDVQQMELPTKDFSHMSSIDLQMNNKDGEKESEKENLTQPSSTERHEFDGGEREIVEKWNTMEPWAEKRKAQTQKRRSITISTMDPDEVSDALLLNYSENLITKRHDELAKSGSEDGAGIKSTGRDSSCNTSAFDGKSAKDLLGEVVVGSTVLRPRLYEVPACRSPRSRTVLTNDRQLLRQMSDEMRDMLLEDAHQRRRSREAVPRRKAQSEGERNRPTRETHQPIKDTKVFGDVNNVRSESFMSVESKTSSTEEPMMVEYQKESKDMLTNGLHSMTSFPTTTTAVDAFQAPQQPAIFQETNDCTIQNDDSSNSEAELATDPNFGSLTGDTLTKVLDVLVSIMASEEYLKLIEHETKAEYEAFLDEMKKDRKSYCFRRSLHVNSLPEIETVAVDQFAEQPSETSTV